MIVFATIRCSRLDQIASSGFDSSDDVVARYVSSEQLGAGAIYCSDEPVTEVELPADFHVAYVLDVPEAVLEQHAAKAGGWLLPIGVANDHRGICQKAGEPGWPCAIDLDPNVSTPIANLDDIERSDVAGWMKTVGDSIRERRATRGGKA